VQTHILRAGQASDGTLAALVGALEDDAVATLEPDGTRGTGEAVCMA
jgi:hypothetical protein